MGNKGWMERLKAEATKGLSKEEREARRQRSVESAQRNHRARAMRLSIPKARYLGGTVEGVIPPNWPVKVDVDESGVGIASTYSAKGMAKALGIPWSQVVALDVEDAGTIRNKVTATRVVLLGPLAAGLQKTERTDAAFVNLDCGDLGAHLLRVDQFSAKVLHERLAPFQGFIQRQSAEPPTAPASMAGELKQLVDMHADGALTDEEFAAAKARLIG